MHTVILTLCLLIGSPSAFGAKLVEQENFTVPEYASITGIERCATQKEYDDARKDSRFRLALGLATRLQALGEPYELIIRSGANHVLTEWREERDQHAIEWFRRHMLR